MRLLPAFGGVAQFEKSFANLKRKAGKSKETRRAKISVAMRLAPIEQKEASFSRLS